MGTYDKNKNFTHCQIGKERKILKKKCTKKKSKNVRTNAHALRTVSSTPEEHK